MAWVSAAYLTNQIGAEQVAALGLVNGSDRLTQYELDARSKVIAGMLFAGYAAPDATLTETTNDQQVTAAYLKSMCAGIMLDMAYALIPGISLTEQAQRVISNAYRMLNGLFATDVSAKVPIPGMVPSALDGIGGVEFNTDASSLGPTTTPVFRQLRGSSF